MNFSFSSSFSIISTSRKLYSINAFKSFLNNVFKLPSYSNFPNPTYLVPISPNLYDGSSFIIYFL